MTLGPRAFGYTSSLGVKHREVQCSHPPHLERASFGPWSCVQRMNAKGGSDVSGIQIRLKRRSSMFAFEMIDLPLPSEWTSDHDPIAP